MMMMKIFQGGGNPRSKNSKEGVSFDPQPLPQSYTNTTSPSLNIWASEQRRLKPPARKESTSLQESQFIADVVTLTKTPDVLPIQKYYTIDVVIKRFLTRLQGRLRDRPWEHITHAREEFLKMKCCSFQKKDLEKQYDRMSQRFYCLNVVDDVNLRQVFLNSFPESLGNEAYRALEARNKKFLAEFERTEKCLGTACDDKYLQIKSDDKFPLPQKKSLFQHLADAKVLSKFDLKSGFWQLGIKPEDRPMTAFCIPDHHYQWKVMSFGLKNAPSAFQKAMLAIFEPILANILVYIDDILLFSPNEQYHAELLSKFYSLVTKYGIMLSEKKMEVGVTTIQFLGMEISDGRYQPQPHVAQELLKFPDELSSQKMIQQFLGWLTTTGKKTYVLVMFRRPGSFLPPKAVNDDGSVVYHAPYCFIHDWYKVNSSSRKCERKLQTLYTDTRANGQWLYDNFDHCEVETSDDDDDASGNGGSSCIGKTCGIGLIMWTPKSESLFVSESSSDERSEYAIVHKTESLGSSSRE
nr:RNA-directed DNA polymerase homolog [Tanacetum cinerariifolium]